MSKAKETKGKAIAAASIARRKHEAKISAALVHAQNEAVSRRVKAEKQAWVTRSKSEAKVHEDRVEKEEHIAEERQEAEEKIEKERREAVEAIEKERIAAIEKSHVQKDAGEVAEEVKDRDAIEEKAGDVGTSANANPVRYSKVRSAWKNWLGLKVAGQPAAKAEAAAKPAVKEEEATPAIEAKEAPSVAKEEEATPAPVVAAA